MTSSRGIFWRSVQPLVGSVIGVGIFGLPFVFAQSGFSVGLVHLVVVGLVNLVVLLIYADILMNTQGNARLTGIVERYLGKHWASLATGLLFGASWGAMVAYIIIGGEFLQALLGGVFGLSTFVYQMGFFAVSAVILIGGLGFISRLEVYFVLALLIMLFIILTGSLPYASFENVAYVEPKHWFAPFGVVLFAFGGLAAIPEMAHILGRKKHKLRSAILLGIGLVFVVYVAFSGIVVAVTGTGTSEEAVLGLGAYVGSWITVLGAVIGLFAVLTSFLVLGISITDTLVFDYKWRYLKSWGFTVVVPLIVFLLGARDFIDVIGFTGAVLGGFTGLLVIYTYLKAKKHVCTPKRCLQFPRWLLYLCALVFIFGMVATMVTMAF